MTVSRVHITPHMHWDREWYFTTEESRILLVNNMAEILARLESDPDYKFYVLDGQTAVLEDYFAIQPENKARVKALVEAGKLIIGPWYTQTDTMQVSGESILRNLLYGMRDCLSLGATRSACPPSCPTSSTASGSIGPCSGAAAPSATAPTRRSSSGKATTAAR